MSTIHRNGRPTLRTAMVAVASAILTALVVGGPSMISETASGHAHITPDSRGPKI